MTNAKQFDAVDAQILVTLDDDPNASITQIAKTVGLSRNTVHARLQRLEKDGALEGLACGFRQGHWDCR